MAINSAPVIHVFAINVYYMEHTIVMFLSAILIIHGIL